ncbi:hypothetical protein UFOVP1492_132 [uncultured Caudovirales phage]|uniref:Uncharacterized protein n=1 Tax=uncultured Caudovirales phage TaxID=2100421 RepID=A0A6J5SRS3_9CAUD|nr:hypothetical protein UFOVP1127_2 [uncultured Caudovirales phage]CAB4193399.1 hypothetical protein UFOVP1242_72 [uncultured Caudovirales phage]CAB4217930.1 hypothetical protein UFOVP1492_132 [uncultured Caudovirales phage]CAB5231148.1 hypothetical protein UFOVP1580_25 [uncultured Caudovirales phage]
MNLPEQNLLKELVRSGMRIHWIPDEETAKNVTVVGNHPAEHGLCAYFGTGQYAALDNCELNDFAMVSRLTYATRALKSAHNLSTHMKFAANRNQLTT